MVVLLFAVLTVKWELLLCFLAEEYSDVMVAAHIFVSLIAS